MSGRTAGERGSVRGVGQDGTALTILTRRSDPSHRIAFGTAGAAARFVATTRDPGDWTLDYDLQASADAPAPPTA